MKGLPQLLLIQKRLRQSTLPTETYLAPLNRRSENVLVKAIIIPELELRNVVWHVLGAYLVERADDTALEDAPKTFNRLGVTAPITYCPLA